MTSTTWSAPATHAVELTVVVPAAAASSTIVQVLLIGQRNVGIETGLTQRQEERTKGKHGTAAAAGLAEDHVHDH